jgi:hypothetical protein
MKVIDIKDVDFVNYKLPSMYIIMPYCSFKCGAEYCQNAALSQEKIIDMPIFEIIDMFKRNPVSKAIVFGGLEPFDSTEDLRSFMMDFRYYNKEPVVIYTGYTEEEVKRKFDWIFFYENVIIKYGRYIPGEESHYDEILGVNLSSNNQYAKIYNEV